MSIESTPFPLPPLCLTHLDHVLHADLGLGHADKRATGRLHQSASRIDVVVREVVQKLLQGNKEAAWGVELELGQLSKVPRIAHPGLQREARRVLSSEQRLELGLEVRQDAGEDIREDGAQGGDDACVEGNQLQDAS